MSNPARAAVALGRERSPGGKKAVARWAVVVLCLAALVATHRVTRAVGMSLSGVDLGSPGAPGSESFTDGVWTVTGAGTGLFERFTNANGNDNGHVSYATASGDIEIMTRVLSFDGEPEAQVGLLLRESSDPKALTAFVVAREPASAGENPLFFVGERRPPLHPIDDPGQSCANWNGLRAPLPPPYWLKLVRVGGTFAAFRSSDGQRWSPVANYSGGGFGTTGSVLAGIFVSGGASGVTATATLDSLYIGPPRLEYRTSVVGNTYSSDADGWVPQICAIWVSPDGRCYTSTYYDEAGSTTRIIDPNGRNIGTLWDRCYGGGLVCDGSVTGDGANVYIAYQISGESGVVRTDASGDQRSAPVAFDTPIARIGGMAAANGELYASDVDGGRVVVASTTTMAEVSSFPFVRPGPIAVDSRGDLWIIQGATDWPLSGHFTHPYAGAVRCFQPSGTFTGREITDVVNPSSLCVDPNQDRLLVCENGPDQNIRIYTDLAGTPLHSDSFGPAGGLFGGGVRGRIDDPGSGGWTRLYGPSGVGIDSGGNLFVSCAGAGGHLRKFDPSGNLLWHVSGLPFRHCPDFDPDSDGQDLYMGTARMRMDYSQTAPGAEWDFAGLCWNPYGPDPITERESGTIFRRLGPNRDRYMYVVGNYGWSVWIYRFDGDQAIQCGWLDNPSSVGRDRFWIDLDGDGLESPGEISGELPPPNPFDGGRSSIDVDANGDIYVLYHFPYDWAAGRGYIRQYRMLGFTAEGAPMYGIGSGEHSERRLPSEIPYGRAIRYDHQNDAMYMVGYDGPEPSDGPKLCRYDGWSSGTPTLRTLTPLPTPLTDPNFLFFPPYPTPEGFDYWGLDVASGMVFLGEFWGPVHVYDATLGNEVTRFSAGPEVSGVQAFLDVRPAGLRATRRSSGEFVVVREDSGYRNRDLLWRWTPPAPAQAPEAPRGLSAEGGSRAIRLTWEGGFGMTRKYTLWRGTVSGEETILADDLTSPTYDDETVSFGVQYYYRVTASNEAGTSPPSNEISASAHTRAAHQWEDTTTKGNWRGAYGSQGYTVIGDGESYPSSIEYAVTGKIPPWPPNVGVASTTTTDPNALENIAGTGRIAGFWVENAFTPKLTLDLDIVDGSIKPVALYFFAWGSDATLTSQVEIYDSLGELIDDRTLTIVHDGEYQVWAVSGHVRIVFTPICPPIDPTCNAIGISGVFVGCGSAVDDMEGDGVEDCVDNCPAMFNPLQEDCDRDGIGDACESPALRGTVDAGPGGAGPVATLLTNDASNSPCFHFDVSSARGATLRIVEPPSRVGLGARYAIYAWPDWPETGTEHVLPRGIGTTAMRTPIAPRTGLQPVKRAINILGQDAQLGVENWPGPPTRKAPHALLVIPPDKLRRMIGLRVYFQGIERDDRSAGDVPYSVTNGQQWLIVP